MTIPLQYLYLPACQNLYNKNSEPILLYKILLKKKKLNIYLFIDVFHPKCVYTHVCLTLKLHPLLPLSTDFRLVSFTKLLKHYFST